MSIEVSFKKKLIRFVDDGKHDYVVVDEEVDPGEVDDEDLFTYRS